MDRHLEINVNGFGGACFCVEDDPYGGVLDDEQLCRTFLAHSMDDFWLKIRNR